MAIAFGSSRNLNNSIAFGYAFVEIESFSVPVITLVGSGVTVNLNDSYVEQGYTATDDTDGDITNSVVVTGSVNTSVAGVYTLRYNVTNSVGNAATEVIRLVTVQSFWEYIPPQNRIVDMTSGTQHVKQDPDATLSYWLDMSGLIGDQTITAVDVDPDGLINDLTFNCAGLNSQTETDNLGATYSAGNLIGFCFSGGIANAIYRVVVRYTLSGGDVDDRTVVIHVIDT